MECYFVAVLCVYKYLVYQARYGQLSALSLNRFCCHLCQQYDGWFTERPVVFPTLWIAYLCQHDKGHKTWNYLVAGKAFSIIHKRRGGVALKVFAFS